MRPPCRLISALIYVSRMHAGSTCVAKKRPWTGTNRIRCTAARLHSSLSLHICVSSTHGTASLEQARTLYIHQPSFPLGRSTLNDTTVMPSLSTGSGALAGSTAIGLDIVIADAVEVVLKCCPKPDAAWRYNRSKSVVVATCRRPRCRIRGAVVLMCCAVRGDNKRNTSAGEEHFVPISGPGKRRRATALLAYIRRPLLEADAEARNH